MLFTFNPFLGAVSPFSFLLPLLSPAPRRRLRLQLSHVYMRVTISRPSSSLPLNIWIAFAASEELSKVTVPQPFERWLLSIATSLRVTLPAARNMSFKPCQVTDQGRFCTMTVLPWLPRALIALSPPPPLPAPLPPPPAFLPPAPSGLPPPRSPRSSFLPPPRGGGAPPDPPDPPRRSRSSRSSRTRMERPSRSELERALMAFNASSAYSNSTMPHPLERPPCSVMHSVYTTLPT
mmetsp:Transcript_16458/g.27680  ORF Transcript_16458/g.27680 Transcript_16458/m.27680 type:complete len:235 (-) Transcript_16458:184-888(-)